VALLAAIFYYGWPIIEAIILILPIPDPQNSINQVKNAASAAGGMVQGAMSSNRGPPASGGMHSQYSSNLEAQPEAFMEDDNSDEDIGKPNTLDYDSGDGNDEELLGGTTTGSSELIDLGSEGDQQPNQRKAAAKIPKLSGPH